MSERPMAAALVFAAGLALICWPAGAQIPQADNCQAAGEAYLAELDLGGKRVELIEALPRYSITGATGDERIIGYEIGVRLRDCAGWVRIETDPFCRVRQSYTQGGCQVDGLPHYD